MSFAVGVHRVVVVKMRLAAQIQGRQSNREQNRICKKNLKVKLETRASYFFLRLHGTVSKARQHIRIGNVCWGGS